MEYSATIMKILLLNTLLAFAVHADAALPPYTDIYSPSPSPFADDSSPEPSASDDSPQPIPVPEVSPPSPATLLPPPVLPQPPPLPQFSPPEVDPKTPPLPRFPPPREVDPVIPPPMTCKDQCLLKCSRKHGFRRFLCMGKCLGLCKILSPHGGYQCTRDCVMDNLHHQPDIKNLDGLVNTCYNSCSKNV